MRMAGASNASAERWFTRLPLLASARRSQAKQPYLDALIVIQELSPHKRPSEFPISPIPKCLEIWINLENGLIEFWFSWLLLLFIYSELSDLSYHLCDVMPNKCIAIALFELPVSTDPLQNFIRKTSSAGWSFDKTSSGKLHPPDEVL